MLLKLTMVTAQSGVGFKLFACSTDMIRDLKINTQFMAKNLIKLPVF